MTRHRRPRVLITGWRRELKTAFNPKTDLVTIAPAYPDAVRRAGGLPLIAPHLEGDEIGEVLDHVDGLIITGGHDMNPDRYGHDVTGTRSWRDDSDSFDLSTARTAIAKQLPILGICRGLQVINVAMGGDLRQEIQSSGDADHPLYAEMVAPLEHRHQVEIDACSRLAGIYGSGVRSVNSLHHQAAGTVADGLRVVATTADGTIEAVESLATDPATDGESPASIVAVQWHPEMLEHEGGDALFADLVARARESATMAS